MGTKRDRARLRETLDTKETGIDFGYQERQGETWGDSGYLWRLVETVIPTETGRDLGRLWIPMETGRDCDTKRDRARLGETLDTYGDW